jgi:hypothetical protein
MGIEIIKRTELISGEKQIMSKTEGNICERKRKELQK